MLFDDIDIRKLISQTCDYRLFDSLMQSALGLYNPDQIVLPEFMYLNSWTFMTPIFRQKLPGGAFANK